MKLHGPVLVGTDMSPAADEAVRQGAELADALDTALIVCHVVPELLPAIELFAPYKRAHGQVQESIMARARDTVQGQIAAVLTGRSTPADVVLEDGTPHVGVLSAAAARSAGVVVVGPGAEADDIVRHTSSAVLVARPSADGPVVGATDFSAPSMPAIQFAASEARRRGAPLHLLHAFDLNVFTERRAPATAMPYLRGKSWIALEGLDELEAVAQRRLEELLRDANVPGEVAIVSGFASQVIARYAEVVRARLVVIGTHGRSGWQRLTLGSTAASVLDLSPCSTLVVRIAEA